MSNKYREHLVVLVEDDANRQILNGFLTYYRIDPRRIHVFPPSGGWFKLLKEFEDIHVPNLESYSLQRVLMIIDFDNDFENRFRRALEFIPSHVRERVFVIGCSGEPEELVVKLKWSKEQIGITLAEECAQSTFDLWNHALLIHNVPELTRMCARVNSFIFAD